MEKLNASLGRLVLASQELATLYEQGRDLEALRVKVDEVYALVTHLRSLIDHAQDSVLSLDLERQDRDEASRERKS